MQTRRTGTHPLARHGVALFAAGSVLVLARPDWSALSAGLRAPNRWVADVGADVATAALAGAFVWVAAAWLAVGLLAGLAGLVPGAAGRIGRDVAGRMLPAVVRAGLVGAIGVSVVTTPAWAGPAGTAVPATATAVSSSSVAAAPPSAPSAPSPSAPSAPSPSAPSAPSPSAPSAPSPSAPSAQWPTGRGTPSPLPWPGGQTPPHSSTPRPTAPPATPPGTPTAPATRPSRRETVTVRPGDSLWSLATARLGPRADAAQIAAEWPRWYRTNRDAIGNDPGLIHPGLRLTAPAEQENPR